MRVLNSTTLHGRSAGSWYAIRMLKGLAERGHEIHLLVPEGATAEAARSEGFRVRTEPDLRGAGPAAARDLLRRLKRLRDEEVRADVVVAHWGPDHMWWGLAAGSPYGRIPLVRLRAHDPRRPARHPLSRWLHRWQTDAYIVANERQRRGYTEGLRIPPDRVHRVPPGYAPGERTGDGADVRTRLGVPEGRLLVGSIARFAPQKDHATFLEAAARSAPLLPQVHFMTAGYPAEQDADHIRRLASRWPALKGRWSLWTQQLSDGGPLVEAVDIGVVHSAGSEAVCRVAMEYMHYCIPLISTRIGALSEVIQEWKSGLLVPPGEPAALAGAIVRVARSKALRTRLSHEGKARLGRVFKESAAVDRFERALIQTVERARRVP